MIHAPNTLTSTVNKSGSFTLTATDSLNHPLINAQWHIITDYSNLFSVNETTGELS